MILVRVDYVDYGSTTRRLERAKSRMAGVNRESAQRAGQIYRNTARDISPKDSGEFASSWHYKTASSRGGEFVDVTLYNDDIKASFIISGTKPHVIYPKNSKALRFFGSNGEQFAKRVFHPGTAPNDIYSKVVNQVQGEIEDIFESSLRQFSDLI